MDSDLTENLKEMARVLGAKKVGIATRETLEGGPPSTDLEYVFPEAQSAIVYAIPLEQEYIEPFLRKENQKNLQQDRILKSTLSSGISMEIANFLSQLGFKSRPLAGNFSFRVDEDNDIEEQHPIISHKYLAARAGVGFMGYSGEILTKEYGAAVTLGSVVTSAKLGPTEPIEKEDNYCDECMLCCASCIPDFISTKEKTKVEIGGKEIEYGKRKDYARCEYVCNGFSGLHPSGRWSTWSPGRFPIPEKDEGFHEKLSKGSREYEAYRKRKKGGYFFPLVPGYRVEHTCGNCQLVCHPDLEVRKERYRLLRKSGVIVQEKDGSYTAMEPEQAKRFLEDMPTERQRLYE